MQCNGPCDQGRKECPTPQACEHPPEDDRDNEMGYILVISVVFVTVCGLLAVALSN